MTEETNTQMEPVKAGSVSNDGLGRVPRYTADTTWGDAVIIDPDEGDWCRWEDVKKLIYLLEHYKKGLEYYADIVMGRRDA
jgi:hypothetical protein